MAGTPAYREILNAGNWVKQSYVGGVPVGADLLKKDTSPKRSAERGTVEEARRLVRREDHAAAQSGAAVESSRPLRADVATDDREMASEAMQKLKAETSRWFVDAHPEKR